MTARDSLAKSEPNEQGSQIVESNALIRVAPTYPLDEILTFGHSLA